MDTQTITGLMQSVDEEVVFTSDGFADLQPTDLVEMDLYFGVGSNTKKRLSSAAGHFAIATNPTSLTLRLIGEETRMWDLRAAGQTAYDGAEVTLPKQTLFGVPLITYENPDSTSVLQRLDRTASGRLSIVLAMSVNPTRDTNG